MKKLIFVFVTLFAIIIISGCSSRNNNTVRFNGNETDTTSEDISINDTIDNPENEPLSNNNNETTEDSSTVKTTTTKKPSGKLEILSFDGGHLKSNINYNVVRGSASTDTYSITVNDYKLKKYYRGQKEWNYIAAHKYSTLKPGLNNYVVKTFDQSGKKIDSLIFSINYDAPVTPNGLPGVGTSNWLTLIFSIISAFTYITLRKLRWL